MGIFDVFRRKTEEEKQFLQKINQEIKEKGYAKFNRQNR